MKLSMKETNSPVLTVYFDSLCPVCLKEINIYKKKDTEQKIEFIDITSPHFNAKEIGLRPIDLQKKFHVKTADGHLLIGVDGFVEIWRVLNIFKPLKYLATNKISRPIFDMGYYLFTQIRPFIRKKQCIDDYCQL